MEKLQGKSPSIRFPEFKDAWQHKKLSEFLKEAKKRNGDLKYGKEHVLSVSGELGIVNQIEHLGRSYAGVSVHQYHVVEVGDIVYTKSPLKANPFGIIKLNKSKAGIVSTLYAVYNVKEQNAYGPFLDYYFSLDANTNRYLRPLVKKGAKNDMKINNAYVLHDRIFAPSILEQKRIAAFFTVLDKKIAQLKEKKALLEQYKKGVMQKIFSQELRFKDENGETFPDWERKNLGTVAKINPKSKKLPDSFVYIDLESVVQGSLMKEERINKLSAPSRAQRLLSRKDILFQMVRPYQKNNYFFDRIEKDFVASTGYAQIKATGSPEFLFHYLHEEIFIAEVLKKCTGTSYPAINSTDLSSINITIPSLPEQLKIANFLSALDQKIKKVNAQIEQTEQWKKGLLQKMFV
ncbi:MAG: restriction endonuclease subunit S [Cyclobacteriaceae bacterium]